MAVIRITLEVSREKGKSWRSRDHCMKETWDEARAWLLIQCEHYNETGWFVAWRASENGGPVETGESERNSMTITRLRQILKDEYRLGAMKIQGSRYAIRSNGDTLFSLDVKKIKDDQHARERIQQELSYLEAVATRRWQ